MATAIANDTTITVGVFRSEAAARQAVAQLRADGFQESEVQVVEDKEHQRDEPGEISDNTVTQSNSGLVIGGLIGAIVGLMLGFVLGSGLVPLPDLVAGIGLVGTVLAVTAIGLALGALGGSMAGMSVARQETKGLEKAVEAGYWLVSIDTTDQDAASAALKKVGAVDLRVQTAKSEQVNKKT